MRRKHARDNAATSLDMGVFSWDTLWGAAVPPKIRVFAWHACRNYLPCCLNLARRGLPVMSLCPLCLMGDESTSHALVECSWATRVWRMIAKREFSSKGKKMPFVEWLDCVLKGTSKVEHDVFFFTAWAIWNARNLFVHEGVSRSAEVTCNLVDTLVTEYREVGRKTAMARAREVDREEGGAAKWEKPPAGVLKLNTDGAVFADIGGVGLGGVVRNREGEILFSFSEFRRGNLDPASVEALACLEGLKIAAQRYPNCALIVELDALAIVKELNDTGSNLAPYGSIVDVAHSFALSFNACQFVFKRRSANGVAHSLAHLGRTSLARNVWVDVIPDCIRSTASLEASLV